jgi:ribosomal protein L15
MLEKYGNTTISWSRYCKYGDKAILRDLKKHGFKNCKIEIYDHRKDPVTALNANSIRRSMERKPTNIDDGYIDVIIRDLNRITEEN